MTARERSLRGRDRSDFWRELICWGLQPLPRLRTAAGCRVPRRACCGFQVPGLVSRLAHVTVDTIFADVVDHQFGMGASIRALQFSAGARQVTATCVDLHLLAGQLVLDFLPARIVGTMMVRGPAGSSQGSAHCWGLNRLWFRLCAEIVEPGGQTDNLATRGVKQGQGVAILGSEAADHSVFMPGVTRGYR